MFSNSRNFVIQGGTFQIVNASGGYNENGSGGSGGLDILHRHIATGAMHDSAERSNAPTCHPDTRIAVLNDIMGWVEDEHRETDILWLHGPAGAGKTSICQTLAEMCQEKGELAATFFFARGAPGRDNDRSLVPTIAYQIAHSFEASRDYISTSVLKDPLQIFAKSLPTQMRQLVIQPLKQAIADITGPYPKLLIIDGLDECQPEDSQENILRVIYNTLKNRSLPLCILLASRKEPHIRDAFEGDLHEFTYPIALDDKYNPDQDIATYLRSSFATILRKHRNNRSMASLPLPWPPESVIHTLVAKASGQFIYAATVVRFVDVRHQSPSKRLAIALGLSDPKGSNDPSPFAELDKLYQEIFRGVSDLPLTLRILGAILALQSPLPIDALEDLLGLQPGDTDLALVKLHSVLYIPDSPDLSPKERYIHLYHASLGEFLFDPKRAGAYHLKLDSVHYDIAQCCSFRLNQTLAPFHSTPWDPYYFRSKDYDLGDTAAIYIRANWMYHLLTIEHFNSDIVSSFAKVPPAALLGWLQKESFDPMDALTVDPFSTLAQRFRYSGYPEGQILGNVYPKLINTFFKHMWKVRFNICPEVQPTTLGILAMTMQDPSFPSVALGHLLQLDWAKFSLATFVLRPFMVVSPFFKFKSQAFSEYIVDPSRCGEYNPMTPDIHADLVIYCVEYLKCYQQPSVLSPHRVIQDGLSKPQPEGGEGACLYATTYWKDHLRQADPRRLLNYAYFVNARHGHFPICTHENRCHIRCEVVGIHRCIEARIVDGKIHPQSLSTTDMKLLPLLREIIDIKYLGTPLFSRVKLQMEDWGREYRIAVSKTKIRGTASSQSCLETLDYVDYVIQEAIRASRKGYKGMRPL